MTANVTSLLPSTTTISNLFQAIRKSIAVRLSFLSGKQPNTFAEPYDTRVPEPCATPYPRPSKILHLFDKESVPVGTSRIEHLLRMLWRSTIFGDAFPNIDVPLVSAQLQEVYREMAIYLVHILTKAMPSAPDTLIKRYVHEIAPKATAFSVAIAAGELDDREVLRDVALVVALNYWADHLLDRGDEPMEGAFQLFLSSNGTAPRRGPEVEARLQGLREMERLIEGLSLPEDVPYILAPLRQETMEKQYAWRKYSQEYLNHQGEQWSRPAIKEIAACSIANTGLVTVTAILYGAYRRLYPALPSLKEIFEEEALMETLQLPCQAAIRVFDDVGDRVIDRGETPGWGDFSINLFNHPDGRLLDEFLYHAGISNSSVRTILLDAFEAGGALSQSHIIRIFMDLVYEKMGSLPAPLWERCTVFLGLAKRLVEAGYVNAIGDQLLVEREVII